jgi:hypothetical protein
MRDHGEYWVSNSDDPGLGDMAAGFLAFAASVAVVAVVLLHPWFGIVVIPVVIITAVGGCLIKEKCPNIAAVLLVLGCGPVFIVVGLIAILVPFLFVAAVTQLRGG